MKSEGIEKVFKCFETYFKGNDFCIGLNELNRYDVKPRISFYEVQNYRPVETEPIRGYITTNIEDTKKVCKNYIVYHSETGKVDIVIDGVMSENAINYKTIDSTALDNLIKLLSDILYDKRIDVTLKFNGTSNKWSLSQGGECIIN